MQTVYSLFQMKLAKKTADRSNNLPPVLPSMVDIPSIALCSALVYNATANMTKRKTVEPALDEVFVS